MLVPENQTPNSFSDSMALPLISEGTRVRVVGILCDLALRRRLTSLGVRQDTEMQLLQQSRSGRAVVRIGFGRIALGPEIAQALRVVPLPERVETE